MCAYLGHQIADDRAADVQPQLLTEGRVVSLTNDIRREVSRIWCIRLPGARAATHTNIQGGTRCKSGAGDGQASWPMPHWCVLAQYISTLEQLTDTW
jgi:hypothetical protein